VANWQSVLDLIDVWDRALGKEVSIPDLSRIISERLKVLKPCTVDYVLDEQDGIVDEFMGLYEEDNADPIDFDAVMNRLYDWADQSLDEKFGGKKVCWIKTFF